MGETTFIVQFKDDIAGGVPSHPPACRAVDDKPTATFWREAFPDLSQRLLDGKFAESWLSLPPDEWRCGRELRRCFRTTVLYRRAAPDCAAAPRRICSALDLNRIFARFLHVDFGRHSDVEVYLLCLSGLVVFVFRS